MKKTMILAIAAIAAMAAISAQDAQRKHKSITPERYAENLKRFLTKTGGYIVGPTEGRSVIIANTQKIVEHEVFKKVAEVIFNGPHLVSHAVETNAADKAKILADPRTGVMIQVVDESDTPSLLVAPDARWAKVNIRALASDGAQGEKLAARASKQVWRAAMMLMGAANSNFQPCLMQSYSNLAELDGAPATPSPEPFDKVSVTAKKYGMAQPFRTTYLNACRAGWAPAPTNDYQKAIWDKVHELPSAPIKIKPETRKTAE